MGRAFVLTVLLAVSSVCVEGAARNLSPRPLKRQLGTFLPRLGHRLLIGAAAVLVTCMSMSCDVADKEKERAEQARRVRHYLDGALLELAAVEGGYYAYGIAKSKAQRYNADRYEKTTAFYDGMIVHLRYRNGDGFVGVARQRDELETGRVVVEHFGSARESIVAIANISGVLTASFGDQAWIERRLLPKESLGGELSPGPIVTVDEVLLPEGREVVVRGTVAWPLGDYYYRRLHYLWGKRCLSFSDGYSVVRVSSEAGTKPVTPLPFTIAPDSHIMDR